MALRRGLLAGTLSATVVLAACQSGDRMAVSWTGADTGQATLAARAMRCRGEVRMFATSGDTGVAIVLFPNAKVLATDDFPVLAPTEARETRPAAAVASRWTDSVRVEGYRGVEGTVRVTVRPRGLDGEFRALVRRDGDLAEVTLRGRFSGIAVGACADTAG